jgi:hypothetical protein
MRTSDHETLDKVLEETFIDLETEFNVRSRFATRLIPFG